MPPKKKKGEGAEPRPWLKRGKYGCTAGEREKSHGSLKIQKKKNETTGSLGKQALKK